MWFRRDLRLLDHPALAAASSQGPVLALFVLDPALLSASGRPRTTFLCRSLSALDHDLRRLGGALVIRSGQPERAVPEIVREVAASPVHISSDFGPLRQRERQPGGSRPLPCPPGPLRFALRGEPWSSVVSKGRAVQGVLGLLPGLVRRVHNRVRMIVASFLVKDLHIDWVRGARHFMTWLVDGDLASNQHGWQWTAGTGTDAAPYYRVFNPVSQGRKFDPVGTYVRRWVPELAEVATEFVHDPWRAPGGVPKGYMAPIVDHAVERVRSLEAYQAIKRGTQPSH